MANRIPLIVDRDDSNKLKELKVGDNLDLTGSGIIGAGNIAATGLTIAGVSYNPFSGSWNDLADKPTVAATTSDLPEGTNQYFTNERVDDRVAAMMVEGSGIDIVYNDLAGTLTITATGGGGGGSSTLDGLSDVDLTTSSPANNQVLKYSGSGSNWVSANVNYSELVGSPTLATVATTGSYSNLIGKPSIPVDISDLSDVDTESVIPTTGQILKWDGTKWAPGDDITSGGAGLNATTLNGFDSAYYLNYTNFTNKPALFDGEFSSLTGTPTTISGYGITDAVSTGASYTQNGAITVNDNDGITVGTAGNLKIYANNGGRIESLVTAENLDIRVKPITGVESAIHIATGNKRIGIFTTTPTTTLDVGTGSITAASYYGSGTNLSGITLNQITTSGSETTNSISVGNLNPAASLTYSIGSASNQWSNVYSNVVTATTLYGNGANITAIPTSALTGNIDYTSSTISNKPTIPTAVSELTNDSAFLTTISGQTLQTLSNVAITSPSNGQSLKYDGTNWINGTAGDTIGNFTMSASVIDTDDSSGITITPAVTTSSDLTVENNLVVRNIVTADSFESSSTGIPEIRSSSRIELIAEDAVVINKSPLRLATFTTTARNALTATNGDTIYNETTNKFQGYAGGAWVDLH